MVSWFKRAGVGAPEAASAPAHAALAAAVVQAEHVARLEHWVEQLRNELDTKASALLRASMRHEALREELESANAKLGELKEQLATAGSRASDAEKRVENQQRFGKHALTSAQRRQDEVAQKCRDAEKQLRDKELANVRLEQENVKLGERVQAEAAAARVFEHKLQHAESTVQSLGLERQSFLAKVALLEERCNALGSELGPLKTEAVRQDAEVLRLRAEAAPRSYSGGESLLVDELRRSLNDLAQISARALDALAGTSLHLAFEIGCRAQRNALAVALGSARTRADAVARVHEHLRLLGFAQALSARGSEESAELELELVPASSVDETLGRWLAAYAVECVNVCLSESFRLDRVEGSSVGLDIRATRAVVAASSFVAVRAAASNSILAARAHVAENSFDDEGAALRSA